MAWFGPVAVRSEIEAILALVTVYYRPELRPSPLLRRQFLPQRQGVPRRFPSQLQNGIARDALDALDSVWRDKEPDFEPPHRCKSDSTSVLITAQIGTAKRFDCRGNI